MENWKTIENYPNYMVSDLGRVKHIAALIPYMHAITKNWHFRSKKEHILTPRFTKGYNCVQLNNKQHRVCRLVAKHFLDNSENKPEVNHINGKKNDDRISNLEWVTKSENMRHAVKMGLMDKCFERVKITHSRAVKCLRTGQIFNSIRDFSEHRKIDPSNITRALNGTYKNNHDVEFVNQTT
jgi:hypothetical protein